MTAIVVAQILVQDAISYIVSRIHRLLPVIGHITKGFLISDFAILRDQHHATGCGLFRDRFLTDGVDLVQLRRCPFPASKDRPPATPGKVP